MHRRCYLMILFNITALSNIWVALIHFFLILSVHLKKLMQEPGVVAYVLSVAREMVEHFLPNG